ncbi:hypothetical protein [Nitratireductor basaltis]|uniref:Transmembrane protein n=1 Tax=Nitratireductor basaltis TaxID=472175 RepID=A0A084UB05_9HYPH|nr:hypothetical protein [Nitratireductor basaltis]KFB10141.1 hypothetical protein EL18_01171 [Nitratireductor basaltis]
MGDLRDWAKEPQPRPSPTGTLAYVAAGVLIWGVQFMGVYALHTLLCRLGFSQEVTRWVVLAATAVTMLLIGMILLRINAFARLLGLSEHMDRRKAYDTVAQFGLVLALFAVAWTGIAAALLSSCT